MNPLESFKIPVKGLKDGVRQFDFELNQAFFKAVHPDSEIEAKLQAKVLFDKRPSMYILDISIDGTRTTACDRCLEYVPISVQGEHRLYIKRGDAEDEADVVYLPNFDDQLNIAKYIYEYAILSFPLINACEEEDGKFCNEALLDKLDEQEETEEPSSSIWDELNKLNLE